MEDFVPFGSRWYGALLLVLLFARGMDFLSTWIATPTLALEGNPLAKRLGWKWGIPVNLMLCLGFACWPVPAIVISTTSLLVAARNFQSAWLMRSLGEYAYREWHVQRIQETKITLFLFCLFAQTALVAMVGGVVVFFSAREGYGVLLSVGIGIVAYAVAVLIYSILGVWRLHRAGMRELKARQTAAAKAPAAVKNGKLIDFFPGQDLPAPGG
jgi:hypothetical protein